MPLDMKRLTFLLFSFLVITGCSSSNPDEGTKPKDEVKEIHEIKKNEAQTTNANVTENEELILDSPALPSNLDEILAYPAGPFMSDDVRVQDAEVQKELDAIPAFPEDASDSELTSLFAHLYSLFKKEYEDPKQIMEAGNVTAPDPSEAEELVVETFNVEVILDSSGSMANKMGSKTRMELAKESINKFAVSLPKEANISLRVYGHKGTNSESDKKFSCSANELVYPLQPYNQAGLAQALSKFQPAGWTPLAQAIIEAQKDLSQYKGEKNKNIIYVVSDGIETCGGDPVAAAKSLKDSGIAPVVTIIGFDVAGKDQQQLQEVAKVSGGTYANVTNQGQLQNELNKTIEESLKWLNWKNRKQLDERHKFNLKWLDITSISNTWYMRTFHENNLIVFSLYDLQSKQKITYEQNDKIIKMVNAFYEEQRNSVEELKEVLQNATEEDKNATLDKIDQIYEKNVSQN